MMSNNESKSSTEEEKVEEKEKDSKPKKTMKYVFPECVKCGDCCADRSSVPVTFIDLEKWMKKGVIQSVFPYLQLEVVKASDELPEYIQMSLKNRWDYRLSSL